VPIWRDSTLDEPIAMQQTQTACGETDSAVTSGLVAYLGDVPVGWVAVEPRVSSSARATATGG